MHGSVINVPTNVDQTQSILPRLPHDGVIIGVFLKWCLEYTSPYISKKSLFKYGDDHFTKFN
jgi:hypothetical protein